MEPAIKCPPSGFSQASIWAGIVGDDGHGTGDSHQRAEQAGTYAWCDQGIPEYSAWTYAYPNPKSYVGAPFRIYANDQIWAQVTFSGPRYTMTIADLTQHQITSATATVRGASRLDAQWIVQTPQSGCPKRCVPDALAQFRSVPFTGAEATIGGVLGGLSHWVREALTMGAGSIRRGLISTVSHGGSFTVTWHHK